MAEIVIPYKPREQFQAYHDRTTRFAALVAHRRAGKTVAVVNDLIRSALTCPRPTARVAYTAPTYGQAKDVAWEYVKQFAGAYPGVSFHETELRADFPNGARLRLYGLENYDRLRGLYFDDIALDEYGDSDPRAWTEVIRPALSDREGRATFIGTPKGRNHFADLVERAKGDGDWFWAEMKASQTGLVSDTELFAARQDMTREQYAQEYECSFDSTVVGAYYAEELEAARADGRVGSVPYAPEAGVWTYWDLGLDDATAVWFVQNVGREIRLIDYQEWTQTALMQVAREVMGRSWSYIEHVLPHDVEVREMTTGRSRRDVLEGILGQRIRTAPNTGIDDGINATRVLFSRMWFDEKGCQRGLEALRNYRRQWDEKRKVFYEKPFHDWSSHCADALRMLGVGYREHINRSAAPLRRSIKGVV